MHLTQAATRAETAAVRTHLDAAIDELETLPASLLRCPSCGRVGLPERIGVHDCPTGRSLRGEANG
ncbi:hypothetical protein SAMN04488691_11013 [Haloferax larsenii]|uniref:Uncharacterized protein n=1 Tax=Haloferax larsenii TaxID=302484 RepID=A0A1H7TQC2_HALLR|nr:hypothetical protein SAMN04488691_11013 [Haloferax larsenii]